MADRQTPWMTRLGDEDTKRADLVAAACGCTRYELAKRAILGVVEAFEAKHHPTIAPSADAGEIPPAVVERGALVRAIHEAGVRRAALLHQLDADVNEAAVTDPAAADLLRGVAASLRAAEYSYDPGSRKWTIRIGDVAQSIVAPGFSPNALTVTA